MFLYLQVPSYISRSVAGSYDNEAVAIFALVFTFYLYVKVKDELNIHKERICFIQYINQPAAFFKLCTDTEYRITLLCYLKCSVILLHGKQSMLKLQVLFSCK